MHHRPAELLQLAQAWDAMQLPVGIKMWRQWRLRLTDVLPAFTPTQLVAMLRCSSFLTLLGPSDASQRAGQRFTSGSVIRQITQVLLSSQVRALLYTWSLLCQPGKLHALFLLIQEGGSCFEHVMAGG